MKELRDILFLDIETVSSSETYEGLNERMKTLWSRKASFLKREEGLTDDAFYFQRAGIYAEFGKVVSIGIGLFHMEEDKLILRLKALYDEDEKALLEQFNAILGKMRSDSLKLCAHNGREFDFPYLSRRMLINSISLPSVLDLSGKKPWEINHIDTMDMWKFGDWKHYTSLDLLAAIFNIESSKTDMSGSDVNRVYYKDQNLEKIADYCLQDVAVTAQLYLKLKNITAEPFEVTVTPAN
ncbi:3'-5' exonuclease [Fulvivirga kasyanovii]|uniref:3'-5' exonuclease n=1 Tax=Fulvivirga kasyanovii TaxID=396812 RepID=A0ABW9RV43_9BACT|nr:3'-5' exonuclease [Fulvivirga kasyanovii]MTI28109.1 3'-5' exonuclease [Fulvivirga kasyanovii]